MQWEPVIGLEVHVQLKTKSKIFSGSATQYGADPNTQANIIDLGFPGVLPVLNREAVRMAIRFGLSVQANIAKQSVFARKNYFYPDLPKGYQISQFDLPILSGGYIDIVINKEESMRVKLTRAHLEEDAGKSLHEDFHGMSGIDLNRAGTPLLEIVSEPDLRSAEQAAIYFKTLHGIVTYLDICDGNLQEGSMRCDANVSVRPKGETKFGTRTEIKNVNSFKYVEKAIEYEIARQIQILESGGKIIQETRLYDADKDETRMMRSKEEAMDYRYFPDPDLLPVVITTEMIEEVRRDLPELSQQKQQRFIEQYALPAYDAQVLTADKLLADYFETTLAQDKTLSSKLVANWLMGDVAAALNKQNLTINEAPITPLQLAQLLQRIHDGTISGKIAKTVFEAMWQGEGDADEIIAKKGLKQVSDSSALEKIIVEIIQQNPIQAADYRAGKEKLFGYFVGQVMKVTQGKANPAQVNEILKQKLQEV